MLLLSEPMLSIERPYTVAECSRAWTHAMRVRGSNTARRYARRSKSR